MSEGMPSATSAACLDNSMSKSVAMAEAPYFTGIVSVAPVSAMKVTSTLAVTIPDW